MSARSASDPASDSKATPLSGVFGCPINCHMKIMCFGSTHIDKHQRLFKDLCLRTSNPVTSSYSYGGVAHNVALNLARLGMDVSILSRLGKDSAGDAVLKHLQKEGIKTHLISRSSTEQTASYTAITSPSGEMVVAFADMEIYDEITPEVLKPLISQCQDAAIWLVDAGLPKESLAYLAQVIPSHIQLWGIAVSIPKLPRLQAAFFRMDTLILNRDEYTALDSCEGIKRIVVTDGPLEIEVIQEGSSARYPCKNTPVLNATGAGDAFMAGFLYAESLKKKEAEQIEYATAAAHITLASHMTVSEEMSLHKLQKELAI